MADTTTVLNPGVGGDSMDESQVSNSVPALVKRPRVVIGGDAGVVSGVNDLVQPVKVDPGVSVMSLPALAQALVSDSPESGYSTGELRPMSLTNDGRLRVSVVEARIIETFFSAHEKSMWGDQQADITQSSSPWSAW